MNHDALLVLFDQEQRINIEYHGMRKEVLPHVIRFVRPTPGANLILYSCLNEENVDAVIQEQIAYFTPMKQPFGWKVYDHDTPSILGARLEAHRFVPEEREAVMVLDLREAPPELLEPVQVDVRRIHEPEQLEDVRHVEELVWKEDFAWIPKRLGEHLAVPGYLSVYVAYANNKPACTGWTYFDINSQFASLWGGSTVEEFRRKGLYTAVLASRIQEAQQRGYRFLTVDASPMSRPIVARHGFRLLTYARDYEWKVEEGVA